MLRFLTYITLVKVALNYCTVWKIMNKVESDKCHPNHKVGWPFTEIVLPFSDESLQLNNYFIYHKALSF